MSLRARIDRLEREHARRWAEPAQPLGPVSDWLRAVIEYEHRPVDDAATLAWRRALGLFEYEAEAEAEAPS